MNYGHFMAAAKQFVKHYASRDSEKFLNNSLLHATGGPDIKITRSEPLTCFT
jgi:hypothetical protein